MNVWKKWTEEQSFPVTFVIETNYSQKKRKDAEKFLTGVQSVADDETDWSADILTLRDLDADVDAEDIPEIKGNFHISFVHTARESQASFQIGFGADIIRARSSRRRTKKRHRKKRKAIERCIGALIDFNDQYADSTSSFALPIF